MAKKKNPKNAPILVYDLNGVFIRKHTLVDKDEREAMDEGALQALAALEESPHTAMLFMYNQATGHDLTQNPHILTLIKGAMDTGGTELTKKYNDILPLYDTKIMKTVVEEGLPPTVMMFDGYGEHVADVVSLIKRFKIENPMEHIKIVTAGPKSMAKEVSRRIENKTKTEKHDGYGFVDEHMMATRYEEKEGALQILGEVVSGKEKWLQLKKNLEKMGVKLPKEGEWGYKTSLKRVVFFGNSAKGDARLMAEISKRGGLAVGVNYDENLKKEVRERGGRVLLLHKTKGRFNMHEELTPVIKTWLRKRNFAHMKRKFAEKPL